MYVSAYAGEVCRAKVKSNSGGNLVAIFLECFNHVQPTLKRLVLVWGELAIQGDELVIQGW